MRISINPENGYFLFKDDCGWVLSPISKLEMEHSMDVITGFYLRPDFKSAVDLTDAQINEITNWLIKERDYVTENPAQEPGENVSGEA